MALHIIRGKLVFASVPIPGKDGSANVLGIQIEGGRTLPLATCIRRLKAQVGGYKSVQVTAHYHVTDTPVPREELQVALARMAVGDLVTTYYHRYSDQSGYLWTSEAAKIGEHDIVKEIWTMYGDKYSETPPNLYLHLEVEAHDVKGPTRIVPVILLGIPIGLAKTHLNDGADDHYTNVALDDQGRAALGTDEFLKDGHDLSISAVAGRWTLSKRGAQVASGFVDIRGLADAFESAYLRD